MADKITTLEVDMEPSKVIEIGDRWAMENRFSVHERTEKRVLYVQKPHFATKTWLSLEPKGSKVLISGWAAPASLAPDDHGNFWRGNKSAIPMGFAFGPIGRYKQHFNKFMEMIKNGTDNPAVISTAGMISRTTSTRDSLATGLLWVGIIFLLSGALNIYTGFQPLTTQMFPDLARLSLQSGMVDTVLGMALLLCSRLLKNGKALSIWVYVAAVLFSVGKEFLKGTDFPFFTILFGAWITSQLLGLKRQGQLA